MRIFFALFLFAGVLHAQDTSSRCPYTYYDECMFSPFVYGEWIYWQPVTQDPMNWESKKQEFTNTGATVANFSHQNESIDFEFSSGFRLGAGYRVGKNAFDEPTRAWQIEAIYTRIVSEASSGNHAIGEISPTNPYENDFLFILLPKILANDYRNGFSRAKLKYDRVDVDFAWPIWMSGNVILRLMTGPVFAWVSNDWKSTWVYQEADPTAINTTDLEWKYWGGGLTIASDVYLPVGKGFGFFADAGLSLLLGKMKENEFYQFTDATHDLSFSTSYRFHSFQPEVSLGVGVDYKRWFHRSWMLHISAGWEFTWWPLLNQFGRVNDPSYNNNGDWGDVATFQRYFDNSPSGQGFHGLTLRGGLDF